MRLSRRLYAHRSETCKAHHFGFIVLLIFLSAPAIAAPRIKNIKVAVSNPTAQMRSAADVVISIPELYKIAPDFKPGSLVVTATQASTVAEDDEVLETKELPSEVDDLNGDGKGDELAFQIDLGAHLTRIVTISYGPEDQIWRLRKNYKQRTDALFSGKIEGLGWESDRIAFRLYLDPRNAIDIYGKHNPTLQLSMYASPSYVYHAESPYGRDMFRVGPAIGIGGVAVWEDGKMVRAAEVAHRDWRILASGPVRSIVEVDFHGWKLPNKPFILRARIPQWAGERGFGQV